MKAHFITNFHLSSALFVVFMTFSYSSKSTHRVLPDNINCDSLDQIITRIFRTDQTFSDNTQEIADRLLLLIERKKCKTLPSAYTLLGSINYNRNKILEAKEYLNKAQSLIKDDQQNTVINLRNVKAYGLLSISENNFIGAEVYFKKASRICQSLDDDLGEFGAKLNLGLTYLNSDRLDEAKDLFLQMETTMGNIKNKQLTAYVYQNLAQIFIKQKNYKEAIKNTQKAYDIWEKTEFNKGLFFCNSNFALIYEEQKDSTLWVEYLHKLIAYTGDEKSFIRHYPYMKLGNYHFAKGKKNEAKKYYELALKQSKTIAEEELMGIISNLYTLYSDENDLESIKRINNEVINIYSYKSKMYTDQINKWTKKEIELENKVSENQQLKSTVFDYVKQAKVRNAILGITLLLSIIGFFFFQKYRFEEKLRLEKQKSQIRNKISKDLHDDVGSILAGISAQADLLEILPNEEIKNSAKNIIEDSKLAMGNMRDTVWAMDSRSDTIDSLKIKMIDFANHILPKKDIEVVWSFELHNENIMLDPQVRQSAYLIFKEAITNIIKHSNTSKVSLSMHSTEQNLAISVQDYGSIQYKELSSGQGLKNMVSRAKSVDGTFNLEFENGCRINYVLPLT